MEKFNKFSLEEIDTTVLRTNVGGLLRHFETKWRARIREAAIQFSQSFHAKFAWSEGEKAALRAAFIAGEVDSAMRHAPHSCGSWPCVKSLLKARKQAAETKRLQEVEQGVKMAQEACQKAWGEAMGAIDAADCSEKEAEQKSQHCAAMQMSLWRWVVGWPFLVLSNLC